MTDLLASPFQPYYEKYNSDIEWEDWGGYGSATLVGDPDEEIKRIRTGTVAFDMSPVVKYRIRGRQAEAFLNKLTTRQMAIKPGRVRYTCWCNSAGKLLDDGTCFRLAEDEYLLFAGDKHADHFNNVSEGLDVEVTDVTGEIAGLTVQGRTSLSTLQKIGVQNLEILRPYSFENYSCVAGSIRISRTGFFGDLGYELWMEYEQVEAVWNGLIAAGVLPIGMATLCNGRLEAGLLIPGEGFDFEPASPDGSSPHPLNRSPLEMDLDFLVNFKKGDFIGRDALLAERENGSTWTNIPLELDGQNGSSHGDKVFWRDDEVGLVTSGFYSVSIERNIALASIKTEHATAKTSFEVEVDGRRVTAQTVEKPFINPERKTQNPAPVLE